MTGNKWNHMADPSLDHDANDPPPDESGFVTEVLPVEDQPIFDWTAATHLEVLADMSGTYDVERRDAETGEHSVSQHSSWEGSLVDDEYDNEGARMPMREGDTWHARISFAAHKIEDWPEGVTARLRFPFIKTVGIGDGRASVPTGEFWITDADGNRLAYRKGGVPSDLLCFPHGDGGMSVCMDVLADGTIYGYCPPDEKLLRGIGLAWARPG